MNPVTTAIKRLKHLEGYRSKPYQDHLGVLSIGYGTNIADGLDEEEAEALLIVRVKRDALWLDARYNWYVSLSDLRKQVLIEMCYQLGRGGTIQFQRMIRALREGRFEAAADEILDSKFARQVPDRAAMLARNMRSG
jgi:lysozyme